MKQIKKQSFLSTKNEHAVQLVSNLPEEIKKFNKTEKSVANFLINIELARGIAYPSQETIANRVGISRRQCNRIIKNFKDIGLVYVKQRWNNSLVYAINPYIMLRPVIYNVLHHLPSLKRIFLYSCIVALHATFGANVSLSNNNKANRYINNIIIGPVAKRFMDNSKISTAAGGPVPNYIKTLPFNLDLHQKIFLCGWSLEALEYANEKTTYAINAKQPWGYFISMCLEYSKENNQNYNTQYVRELENLYNLDNKNLNLRNVTKKTAPQSHSSIFEPEYGHKAYYVQLDNESPLNQSSTITDPKSMVSPKTPKGETYNQPQKTISQQVRDLSKPYAQKEKTSIIDRTSEEYVKQNSFSHKRDLTENDLLEEYEKFRAFLATPEGEQRNANYRKFMGSDIPFRRQGDLDEYWKSTQTNA